MPVNDPRDPRGMKGPSLREREQLFTARHAVALAVLFIAALIACAIGALR